MATLRLTIEVRPDDIANGVRASGSSCAVARAARRAIDGRDDVNGVYVGDGWMGLARVSLEESAGLVWQCDELPAVAAEFVRAFDTGLPVSPVTFEAEFTESP